MLEQKPEKYFV